MPNSILTDEENRIFNQDIIKGRTLDYFYVYDNIPQHYVYRDKLIEGELSKLEKRNKAITENIWLDAYNLNTIYYEFIYGPHGLQMPLQAYIWDAKSWPDDIGENNVSVSYEEFKANLEAWLDQEGWQRQDEARNHPAVTERRILLGAPDRTMRLVSVTPVGNQVVVESIITWSETGIIKETAFAVILLYDKDGKILIDRSYCDMINWPSSPGTWSGVPRPKNSKANQGQEKGWLDAYFNRYKDKIIKEDLSELEKRNKRTVEGPWVDAYNTDLERSIFHPKRYRVQLPLQKVSFSGKIAEEIEKKIKEISPDRKITMVTSYAKGNQVVVESIISWTDEGVDYETPFIAFLLFDEEGLIIRDRSYITLDHFPGASEIEKILGL